MHAYLKVIMNDDMYWTVTTYPKQTATCLTDHNSVVRAPRLLRNNTKRSHTQLDSRKEVIAFQDRVITINIKEAQHPLKREKQVIDKSSIMLKISTKSMHRVLV